MDALTATQHQDNYYDSRLTAMTDLISFNNKILAEYFPLPNKLRPLTCFKSLLIIEKHPQICEWNLKKYTGNSDSKIIISGLLSLELIRPFGRPRLIIPFQKFKVDKGYVITDKGKAVLRKLICPKL